jgi:hypothetical protein
VDPAGRKTSTLDLEWKKIEESKQQQGAYQAMSGGRERPPDLPPLPPGSSGRTEQGRNLFFLGRNTLVREVEGE